MNSERSSVVAGSLWMVGISLALFLLPLINGFVGGAVGGYRAGNVKRALGAAILPALAVALGLWLIVAVLGAPVWGLAAGAAVGILILMADLGRPHGGGNERTGAIREFQSIVSLASRAGCKSGHCRTPVPTKRATPLAPTCPLRWRTCRM